MVFLVLTLLLFIAPFISAQDEDLLPPRTLTIKSFLTDMKAHPENYYVIINRTTPEIDYLYENSSLNNFLNYFGVNLETYFRDDCKNFLLIEIPDTDVGNTFGLKKDYSYLEIYQDAFLQDQSFEYYVNNDWCTFNYTVLYAVPQDLYTDTSSYDNLEENDAKILQVDKDRDGLLSPTELAFYSLDNLIETSTNPASLPDTDYLVIDGKNEIETLPFGSRDYCLDFNLSNDIFHSYVYAPTTFNMSESCVGFNSVSELVCSSGAVLYEERVCPEGYICSSGACIVPHATRGDRNTIFVLIAKFLTRQIELSEIVQAIYSWFGI